MSWRDREAGYYAALHGHGAHTNPHDRRPAGQSIFADDSARCRSARDWEDGYMEAKAAMRREQEQREDDEQRRRLDAEAAENARREYEAAEAERAEHDEQQQEEDENG